MATIYDIKAGKIKEIKQKSDHQQKYMQMSWSQFEMDYFVKEGKFDNTLDKEKLEDAVNSLWKNVTQYAGIKDDDFEGAIHGLGFTKEMLYNMFAKKFSKNNTNAKFDFKDYAGLFQEYQQNMTSMKYQAIVADVSEEDHLDDIIKGSRIEEILPDYKVDKKKIRQNELQNLLIRSALGGEYYKAEQLQDLPFMYYNGKVDDSYKEAA